MAEDQSTNKDERLSIENPVLTHVEQFDKMINLFLSNVFDPEAYTNVMHNIFHPYFYIIGDLKEETLVLTKQLEDKFIKDLKNLVDEMQIKDDLNEIDMQLRSCNSSNLSKDPEALIKGKLYAAKVKILEEKKQSVGNYEEVQKEYVEQLALYNTKKEKLKDQLQKNNSQIEKYNQYMSLVSGISTETI